MFKGAFAFMRACHSAQAAPLSPFLSYLVLALNINQVYLLLTDN